MCSCTQLPHTQGKHGVTESLQLMTGLVSIIQHQSLPYIPLNVSNVLLTLHEPENIEFWDSADPMTAFWEISNQVGQPMSQTP